MGQSLPPMPAAPMPSTTDSATTATGDSSTAMPAWVVTAMKPDTLVQPWKQHAGAEIDDPDFAQGKDTVTFYDVKSKVCYGEGSMAA
ncbi:hypothetical protein JX265_005341 [Neoarthrinium moseri]|uniref:Uncharacterized protein n=1 Tax=Neoarthrinium moseri TaxID=1658444 RepID=A0A9Q0AMP5_9PEZI|nr:uncharacterized protein JN550_006202 [Neoarthrinium moseri]KAI1845651.1 hypothetical protein JX266_008262 [Neoarthrinium moseri]KAI1868627.1 hypothetical protein JN550_006202 [Neoarthrinium moseri]KAI1872461.1 hypothetical protein JX265_005341 [Neoarthrinium moseri]